MLDLMERFLLWVKLPGKSPNLAYNVALKTIIPCYSIIEQLVAANFNIASLNSNR
jgi:hypothetical protein